MALVTKRMLDRAIRDALPPKRPRRLDPPIGGGSDYSDFAFGFSIRGAVDSVEAGKVRQGTRTPIAVAQNNITIAADQTWVYVEYVFGSGLAVVTSNLTEPQTTETTLRYPLHLVRLINGVISVPTASIKHLGDIIIPGVFA